MKLVETIMTNTEQIKQQVKNRGIKGLVHFTHIQNVDSILEHGIMPRRETEILSQILEEQFIFPDKDRADGKNASCLSIMFPNNKMLWHKRQQYPDTDWVFLLLKPDVLWECDCAFYPTNAASNGLRHQPVESFKTAAAFEDMFASKIIEETANGSQPIIRDPSLKPYLPTDVQAEVLVFNTIAPSYILKKIVNEPRHAFYGFRDKVNWK